MKRDAERRRAIFARMASQFFRAQPGTVEVRVEALDREGASVVVGTRACRIEAFPVAQLSPDGVAAALADRPATPAEPDVFELFDLRLPGPTGASAPDAGFALLPSDDIFEVSGPAQVGELWRHVRGTATEVVLAGLLVRYGDRSLGVQNLVLRRRDVRGVAADAELERMDGFTELSVTREAAVIHLAFCSFRVEPSLGLELHRWDVEIEPSGPLEVTVRCIGRVLGGTPTSN